MRKIFIWMICIFGVIAITPSAQAFEMGIRGYYWFPALNGDIKMDSSGLIGTTLDLKSDLGFEDEYYPIVEAFIGLGNHHLSLSYYSADYSGTKELSTEFTFKGKTYNIGDTINSSLKYDIYDFMYQYDLLDFENILAGFSLGIIGKVKIINGDVEIKSTTLTKSASEDFTLPIPMVGGNIHLGIIADLLEARLKISGISYEDGTVFDGQADISLTPFPFVDIHGGYQIFLIDLDIDGEKFNYTTSGPYIALTLSY